MASSSILGALLLLVKTKSDTSGLNKTDRAIRKTSQSLKRMSKDMGFLSKLSKGFMAYIGIRGLGDIMGSYLQFEKDLGAIHSRFYAITQDEEKAKEEFKYISQLANNTALDIKSTADSYSIFYAATQKTLGQGGARGVFEDWTKVSRVLHLSEAQFERVTYALREMSSKGAIYSQDLRMQIGTHVPNAMGIAQKAAEEMGFTGLDWFEKLQAGAKGNFKVTTDFVKRFSRIAREMYGSPEALKKALQQPDALAQMIKNVGSNFLIKFSESGGKELTVGVLKAILALLQTVDLTRLAQTLGKIGKAVGKIADHMPQILNVLKYILKTILTVYLFKFGNFIGRHLFMLFRQASLLRLALVRGWNIMRIKNFPILYKLIFSFIKFGFRNTLKAGLSAVLGLGGPLGWLFSALLWLPDIFKLIKNLWEKTPWGKPKPLGKYIGNTNIPWETGYNIAKRIEKEGINNQWDLYNRLRDFKGGAEITQYFEFNDHGKITINANGAGGTPEDIYRQLENQKKTKLDRLVKPAVNKLSKQETWEFINR